MLIKYMGLQDTRAFISGDTLGDRVDALGINLVWNVANSHVIDTNVSPYSTVDDSFWTTLLNIDVFFEDITGLSSPPQSQWDEVFGGEGGVGFDPVTVQYIIDSGLTPDDIGALTANAGGLGPTGFPTRKNGQTTLTARHEDPFTAGYHGNPGADTKIKSQVIYEGWGNAQALRRLWFALEAGQYNDTHIVDDKTFVSVYVDDDGETGNPPDYTITIGELLGAAFGGGGGVQNTFPYMQRTSTNTGADTNHPYNIGGFRKLFSGAQKYLRIEIANTSTTTSSGFNSFSAAVVDQYVSSLVGQQSYYRIARVSDAAHAGRTPITIVDTAVGTGLQGGEAIEGPCQLEHIMASVLVSGSDAVLEGNMQVFVDNNDGNGYQLYNGFESTGGEDWLLGSWGAVASGDEVLSYTNGSGSCWVRYYKGDPIFAAKAIKVVWWVGQPFQGPWADATVSVKASAGVWFDVNPKAVNYMYPDPADANAIYFDDYVHASGALDGTKFTHQSGEDITSTTLSQWQYSGQSYGSLVSDSCRLASLTVTNGGNTFTDAAAVASDVGRRIYSNDFPFGTYVQSVDTGTHLVTVSANATSGGSAQDVEYGTLNEFVYLTSTELGVSLPDNFWVEARMKMGDAPPFYVGNAEGMLAIGNPDTAYGNAVKVGFQQGTTQGGGTPVGSGAANPLYIWIRDGFDSVHRETPGTQPYNSGKGWAGTWFQFAMKVIAAGSSSAHVYTYYRFDGEPRWRSLSKHPIFAGVPVIGITAYTPMACEVDWIRVRPLLTASS